MVVITIRDTKRPISLEAPKISPVAYLNCFEAIAATAQPPIIPPIIPRIPVIFIAKNPISDAKINDSTNNFMFIDSINNLPVPFGNGFENVAQVIRLVFAATSEINNTKNIKLAGMALIAENVIIATIKKREIPPVPTIISLITAIFLLWSPCTISPSPMSISPSR